MDGTRTFIVHADTDENFDGADLNIGVSWDFFEVENHSVLGLVGSEIDSVGYFGIIVDGDIGGDSFGIFTEGYLLFVDSLLIDTGTHVDIYGWIDGESVFLDNVHLWLKRLYNEFIKSIGLICFINLQFPIIIKIKIK